jgi:hypothetical protein
MAAIAMSETKCGSLQRNQRLDGLLPTETAVSADSSFTVSSILVLCLLFLAGPVADFGRISGISDHCLGNEPGSQTSVFGKGQSYLTNGGLDGRVYWSYFFKLDEQAHGGDIPVFTKTDEHTLLSSKGNDSITPTLKFRQLLDRKVSSTLEPLQEYVYKQWFFQRIITIGDAAHKVSRSAVSP